MTDVLSLRFFLLTTALVALGFAGGACAVWLNWPMPWMLGSLAASAAVILLWRPAVLEDYEFPNALRAGFVALIGVMIGTQVTSDLLAMAGKLTLTLTALVLFIGVTHAGNMVIFRRLGGYDRATAFYSGTPGGLMESILMGESAGADVRILMAQQFLRIILVIALLPLGLSLWLGEPVGSASGLALASGGTPVPWQSVLLIVAAALGGLGLATLIKMPAAHLTGPLVLAALCTVTGLVDLHLPVWMIAMAQLVIGVTLGLRFKGSDARLLRRCLGMALVSVLFMLCVGLCFALALEWLTGIALLHLFISFAPGGVAEMSVIALSLAANPALVSFHHIARILLTVVELSVMGRLLGIDKGRSS